ncbi:MAG TPA: 2Fe-2S iron-sulfur cluster-binding protein [Vicinamibacterales bacterium]|nr:2Fe-2S iron-sulfur cluster-binding protein [Vicinamibacterales bacterium]
MSLTVPPTPSSLLALATTVHLALAALRSHRTPGRAIVSPLAIVSLLLAVSPWLFPSGIGLAFGLGLHAVWFAACERFAPAPAAHRPEPAAILQPSPAAAARERRSAAVSRPKGFVETTVLAVIDEAPHIRSFRMARPEGFEFTAGQFLTVRVRIDGREHARCYSISSAPSTRGYVEITVKRQGLVSNTLHSTLRPGSALHVKAPAGVFVYPAGDDRPLLLLAGGIGITPLLSMLRHALHVEPRRAVTLIYSAQQEDGLAFCDELKALARRHPQLCLVFAVTRGAPGPGIFPGRIDETLIQTMAPHVTNAISLICGPQAMIDATSALLAKIGVPAAQVRSEVFQAAVAASAGRAAAPNGTHAHRMQCARSGATLQVAAGQTLLEAAEAGGVAIDSICRSGVCGTCRTRVIDGDVPCDAAGLDESDREDGYVLACIARPKSDCTVEA